MSPTTVRSGHPLRWLVLTLGAVLAAALLLMSSPGAAHAATAPPDTPGGDQEKTAFYFAGVIKFDDEPVGEVVVGIDGNGFEASTMTDADGRWRLFAFSGAEDPAGPASGIGALCAFLAEASASPVRKFTPQGADIDSVIDVRAIFQQGHRELALEAMPAFLLPGKGRYGLRDYEKMFCPDLKGGQDIFAMRGIDRSKGCMVVVRPDQYVAHVLPLDAHAELAAFFDGFMIPGN